MRLNFENDSRHRETSFGIIDNLSVNKKQFSKLEKNGALMYDFMFIYIVHNKNDMI